LRDMRRSCVFFVRADGALDLRLCVTGAGIHMLVPIMPMPGRARPRSPPLRMAMGQKEGDEEIRRCDGLDHAPLPEVVVSAGILFRIFIDPEQARSAERELANPRSIARRPV